MPDTAVLGGDPADRLPHLVTFSCLYVDGEALLTELDRRGFAVSSGSSCTSDALTPSHVLVAMGALTSATSGSRCIRASARPTSSGSWRCCPRRWPASGRRRPAPRAARPRAAAEHRPAVDSRGRRCPLPILDLARALPGSRGRRAS